MGLQVEPQIFKWLQGLKIVKEGRRGTEGKIQIPENVATRFFDGLLISAIAKKILRHRGEVQAANKLQAIKQNSTPAIRLYNWNLLSDALKKLDSPLDYTQKSKLLNLQQEAILKIIKFLWSIRVQEASSSGHLAVSTGQIGQKSLKEANNVFQFLVVSICTHFKLSVQHALNLFLDNNKYLAHLLVKGVKGSFEPIHLMLKDCRENVSFIVDSLLCVDEQQSLDLFFGALKPCLISKEPTIAETCLTLLKEVIQFYIQKGTKIDIPAKWMQVEGLDTIFFSLKRHPLLFSPALSLAYAFMEEKLFSRLFPNQKSLLWNAEAERLTFFYQILTQTNQQFIQKFIADPVFQEWNKLCLRSLRKAQSPQEQYQLLSLCEKLWTIQTEAFEKSHMGLAGAFILFLKGCALAGQEIVFIQTIRVLFTLTVKLGLAKNLNAPVLYKTTISVFSQQDKKDRIEFMLQNFLHIFKQIPSLPVAPLAEPLLKLLETMPSSNVLELTKLVLAEDRLSVVQKQELSEALAKLIFSDIYLGNLAQEILGEHLMRPDNNSEMEQYCSAALAQFYSLGRQIHRPLRELKQDYQRYSEEESMRKGEPNFMRNISKYIILSNIISFLQKAIFSSLNCKEQVEPHIFHTYIRIEKQLKKQYISHMLMPLLRSYYQEGILTTKIQEYLQETQPIPINFESLVHSDNEPSQQSPLSSVKISKSKKSSLKTEENNRNRGIQSIRKQLQLIKLKRENDKERSMLQQRQRMQEAQKKEFFRSVINEKRIVQYGKTRKNDVDYQNIFDFETAKPTDRSYGLPELQLLDLKCQEEKPYIEDVETVMRKYRKVWRFLFFRYSSFGIKGQAEGQHPEQKINSAQVWKFLKQNQLQGLKRQQAMMLVKRVNDLLHRKGDPQSLSYLAFEQYILQYCYLAFRKSHPSNPPGSQVRELISHLRSIAASKGNSTEIFDCPEQVFFQETDVIRQFNNRLSENPDYPLPQGYKKFKQVDINFRYTVSQNLSKFKESQKAAIQVIDEILSSSMGIHFFEPITVREQRCLARPALFQKLKQKLKDYSGGYLIPKKSAYLPKIEKQVSPFKIQFHQFTEFSLGIKLGLAGVDRKLRYIGQEVAYWLDDALDAVQMGQNKVGNKSKTHVQNELIRRRMSEAVQMKMKKDEQLKMERSRAETLKLKSIKYNQQKQEKQKKSRQDIKLQKQKRKQKEDLLLKKKMAEFQQAKNQLQAKRRQLQQKKQAEVQNKRKDKQEYKKNVEQYFKKKKEELQEKEKSFKLSREYESQQLIQKKSKEIKLKQRLQIEVFKKEEEVLQKVVQTRQSYQEAWKSEQIQRQMQRYRSGLKLIFDLLLKYEKSKISSTKTQEIGLNTLNFYILRTKLVPLLLNKNLLGTLFRVLLKGQNRNGLDFPHFQQLLFRIVVKGKQILNSRKPQQDDGFQMVQPEMLNSRVSNSSPENRKKKSLTDDYTLDANGVNQLTVRRMMQYLNLPVDKQEAEKCFRGLLQQSLSKPQTMVLRQARSLLDSTLF